MTINTSGVATNGGALMLLGSPTYVWPGGSSRSSLPIREDSVIGVERDARGVMRAVPSPFPGRAVLVPRAASAGALGWHVVFAIPRPSTSRSALLDPVHDSVTLWFGQYDGHRWTNIERIATLQRAVIQRRMSSELVASAKSLAFALPIGDLPARAGFPESGPGVAMFIRRSGRWRIDTLRTWNRPAYVSLSADPAVRDGFLVALAQNHFENRRFYPQSLFIARYADSWRAPVLLSSDSGWSVMNPSIHLAGDRVLLAWQRSRESGTDSVQMRWAALTTSDSGQVRPQELATGSAFDSPGIVALDPDHLLLVARDGPSRNTLRVILGTSQGRVDLGTVRAPAAGFAILAIPQRDSTILIATGALGADDLDPPAWTALTSIRIRCSPAR